MVISALLVIHFDMQKFNIKHKLRFVLRFNLKMLLLDLKTIKAQMFPIQCSSVSVFNFSKVVITAYAEFIKHTLIL